MTVNGVQFTWPQPRPGYPDNAIADGQQVTVNAPAGTQTLGFLGAATNGPSQGVVTLALLRRQHRAVLARLQRLDAERRQRSAPSYGNQVAPPPRPTGTARAAPAAGHATTYVYYAAPPGRPGKTLTSVTLPQGATQGDAHIFSIGTSATALPAPVVTSVSPSQRLAGQR